MSTPSLTVEELRARHVAEQAEKRRLREEEDAWVEREFAEGLKKAEEDGGSEQTDCGASAAFGLVGEGAGGEYEEGRKEKASRGAGYCWQLGA